MVDREKVIAVLQRRFPGSASGQVAAAANAIIGLEDEWEELTDADVRPCCNSCYLAEAPATGDRFKVFRKHVSE